MEKILTHPDEISQILRDTETLLDGLRDVSCEPRAEFVTELRAEMNRQMCLCGHNLYDHRYQGGWCEWWRELPNEGIEECDCGQFEEAS